jgi:NADH-quinone oxidoreductase subunit L
LIGHSISAGSPHATTGHSLMVPAVGTSVAVLGIVVAWLGYQRRAFSPAAVAAAAGPLTTLLERRYFIDDLFIAFYRLFYIGLGRLIGWIDRYIIDGLVNLVGWSTWQLAGYARRVQTGRAQDALYAIAVGFLLLALLALRGW